MFQSLSQPPADALHGIMARYAADERPNKIDLGVGVFRDQRGVSPVMRAIAEAERRRTERGETKAYQGISGDPRFLVAMETLVFGANDKTRRAAIQTVGGTGGVYLAMACGKAANPNATVHIGNPTWPNHLSIANRLDLPVSTFEYFDKQTQTVRFDNLMDEIAHANDGDLFVFHGPCHNPTGADLTEAQLTDAIAACGDKRITPLIDAAYYGLGAPLEGDLAALRRALTKTPEAFLVVSCSKAFGLYRERTGVLFALCDNVKATGIVQATLETIGRSTYSMPPAHGAALVTEVLSDEALMHDWRTELYSMRTRVETLRTQLSQFANQLPALQAIAEQRGIFSLLPIDAVAVSAMARDHAVYMPASGRINIAGFKDGDVSRFVEALNTVTESKT